MTRLHATTTIPWPALGAEVAEVRISLREGKLVEMPMPVAAGGRSQCWNLL